MRLCSQFGPQDHIACLYQSKRYAGASEQPLPLSRLPPVETKSSDQSSQLDCCRHFYRCVAGTYRRNLDKFFLDLAHSLRLAVDSVSIQTQKGVRRELHHQDDQHQDTVETMQELERSSYEPY